MNERKTNEGVQDESSGTTRGLSTVFAVARDWLFEEAGKVRHPASRTCYRSAVNETPRHDQDSRSHCDARGENDSGRAEPGDFSCFAESNGMSSPHAVECNSLMPASIGYLRPLPTQSFHSLQRPFAARSAAPVVVAPGHSISPQSRAPSEHEQFSILPDRARLGSAQHGMVLQGRRLPQK